MFKCWYSVETKFPPTYNSVELGHCALYNLFATTNSWLKSLVNVVFQLLMFRDLDWVTASICNNN